MSTELDAQSYELMKKYGINKKLKNELENKTLELYGTITIDFLEMTIKSHSLTQSFTSNETIDTTQEAHNIDKDNIKFPIPVGRDIRLNKKWPYNYNLCMFVESKKNIGGVDNMEFTNYIYDNDLDKVNAFVSECNKVKNKKPITKKTRDQYIKFMVDSGYDYVSQENTPHGVVYKLSAKGKEGCYTTIERAIIKTLLLGTNKNMAKLYAFMKYYIEQDGRNFVPIDRTFLARNIGLSDKSNKNIDTITNMVTTLAQLGLIEIKRQSKSEIDADGNKTYKTINFYRICTYEEWKASRKRARGIKTK